MKNLTIKFILFFILAVSANTLLAMTPEEIAQLKDKVPPKPEPVPVIDEGTINFINGKVIEYHKKRQVHKEALEAYRKQEPIYYKENVIHIDKWKRIAVIKFMAFFEGSRSQIRVYDYNGTLINKETEFRGEVIIATPSDRIMLGQRAKNYNLDKSLLLDKNGRLVAELVHAPNAFKFGSSDDGKIFWILSSLVREDSPRTQIAVYDLTGIQLHTWETDKAQPVGFKYGKKQYKFDVPAPVAVPAPPATPAKQ